MDIRGWISEEQGERRCLHVQGISQWAPANIGPYSQGYLASSSLHVSGQIGLIPGTFFSFLLNEFEVFCLNFLENDSIGSMIFCLALIY